MSPWTVLLRILLQLIPVRDSLAGEAPAQACPVEVTTARALGSGEKCIRFLGSKKATTSPVHSLCSKYGMDTTSRPSPNRLGVIPRLRSASMESRTRRFAGQTLCIPCFRLVEQKI